MTWASIESRFARSSRSSSRSTSFFAASGSREPFAQLLDLAPLVFLAELLADRLHLLPQEHLALPLAQLLLDLRLDVLLGVEHADLALHVHQHAPQPLFDRQGLEQGLALGRPDLEVAGDQIRELARLARGLEHLAHHFVGQTRLLTQLRSALACFAMQRHEGGVVGVDRRQVQHFAHHRFQVAPGLGVVQGGAAGLAVHAAEAALDLADLGDGPRRVQHAGCHMVRVLALRHREDEMAVGLQGRLDGAQRGRASRADRRRNTGKQHDVPEREHRKRQSFRHRLELI